MVTNTNVKERLSIIKRSFKERLLIENDLMGLNLSFFCEIYVLFLALKLTDNFNPKFDFNYL